MIHLVLLLLLVGCKPQLTQEQLAQQCRDRGGIPSVQGTFKCEMPKGGTQSVRPIPVPEKRDKAGV